MSNEHSFMFLSVTYTKIDYRSWHHNSFITAQNFEFCKWTTLITSFLGSPCIIAFCSFGPSDYRHYFLLTTRTNLKVRIHRNMRIRKWYELSQTLTTSFTLVLGNCSINKRITRWTQCTLIHFKTSLLSNKCKSSVSQILKRSLIKDFMWSFV